MTTNPIPAGHGPEYTGHDVIDATGAHVGKVVDVVYDDTHDLTPPTDPDGHPADAATPTWLVVDPGVLRAAHYVPVAGSYRTDDGTIVAGFDKAVITSATKATGDHVITPDQRRELLHHYALA